MRNRIFEVLRDGGTILPSRGAHDSESRATLLAISIAYGEIRVACQGFSLANASGYDFRKASNDSHTVRASSCESLFYLL